MKSAITLTCCLIVVGCAANSGMVATGPDSYLVSRQAATGFSGSGNLKAEAISEANQYCSRQGKTVQITNSVEAQPPYILGNFPKSEIQFRASLKT